MRGTSSRISQLEFADLEPRSTEVDEEAMRHARGSEVTEDLSNMFVHQCLAGLQFDDKTVFNKKICIILA